MGARFVAHAAVLAAFLGLWTWKLLVPNPVPESVTDELSAFLPLDWKFWAAKSLHVGGYAFLTVLAVTLPVPRRWAWRLAALLALHGAGTEIGQTFVPGRYGCVRDVVIDCVGVGIGVALWLAVGRGARATDPAR